MFRTWMVQKLFLTYSFLISSMRTKPNNICKINMVKLFFKVKLVAISWLSLVKAGCRPHITCLRSVSSSWNVSSFAGFITMFRLLTRNTEATIRATVLNARWRKAISQKATRNSTQWHGSEERYHYKP